MSQRKIRSGRKWGQRTLAVEQLETRRLLAGDVDVRKSGSHLIIRGDNEDNAIIITQEGRDRFRVTGVATDDGDTEVNNKASKVFKGIRHIDVDLRGGNDTLGVGNDELALIDLGEELGFEFDGGDGPGNLGDTTPDNADRVRIRGSLIVRMGSGEDSVGLHVDVQRVVNIQTGNGDDGVGVTNSRIGDDLIINTGNGDDNVIVIDTDVNDVLAVITGDGEDTVDVGSFIRFEEQFVEGPVSARHLEVFSGDDDDTVNVSDVFVEDVLIINTAHGEDFVSILGGNIEGDVIINTGHDRDIVFVEASVEDEELFFDDVLEIGHNLIIDSGEGDDEVEVDFVNVDHDLLMFLGTGEDLGEIFDVIVDNFILVDMGSDDDELFIAGSRADHGVLNGGSEDNRDTLFLNDDLEENDDIDVVEFERVLDTEVDGAP